MLAEGTHLWRSVGKRAARLGERSLLPFESVDGRKTKVAELDASLRVDEDAVRSR